MTCDDAAAVVGETRNVSVATTPSWIVFGVIPAARQVKVVAVANAQVTDFPAAAAAAPLADKDTPVKSAAENVRVHCKAAGWIPETPESRITGTVMVPPFGPEPVPTDSVCALPAPAARIARISGASLKHNRGCLTL